MVALHWLYKCGFSGVGLCEEVDESRVANELQMGLGEDVGGCASLVLVRLCMLNINNRYGGQVQQIENNMLLRAGPWPRGALARQVRYRYIVPLFSRPPPSGGLAPLNR